MRDIIRQTDEACLKWFRLAPYVLQQLFSGLKVKYLITEILFAQLYHIILYHIFLYISFYALIVLMASAIYLISEQVIN